MSQHIEFTYNINGVIPVQVEAWFEKIEGDWVISDITVASNDGLDIYGELREVWIRPTFGSTETISVADAVLHQAFEELK
tara:strand:+ start:11327 stop:11566 length:240 start_codon:yes stop_codon:yes gene_type:complete